MFLIIGKNQNRGDVACEIFRWLQHEDFQIFKFMEYSFVSFSTQVNPKLFSVGCQKQRKNFLYPSTEYFV